MSAKQIRDCILAAREHHRTCEIIVESYALLVTACDESHERWVRARRNAERAREMIARYQRQYQQVLQRESGSDHDEGRLDREGLREQGDDRREQGPMLVECFPDDLVGGRQ